MRAVFLDSINLEILSAGSELEISGENHHHLANVVRIQKGESLLIFNGKGQIIDCSIKEIDKRRLTAVIQRIRVIEKPSLTIDLGICLPKAEAFEEILRACVEFGVSKIYPIYSEFSSRKLPAEKRLKKIIESAVIQSNNPYSVGLENPVELDNLASHFDQYDHVIHFTEVEQGKQSDLRGENTKKYLLLIGAEGGFSPNENEFLKQSPNVIQVHLPTSILRCTTALSAAVGFMYGRLSAC